MERRLVELLLAGWALEGDPAVQGQGQDQAPECQGGAKPSRT